MAAQQHPNDHVQSKRDDVSYSYALDRFSKPDVADDYPSKYRNTTRDRREINGIHKSLRDVPPRAHVLDLPCGSGRLMELLLSAGYSVTCADSSPSMVDLAEARWLEIKAAAKGSFREPRFFVSNVLQTGFADNEFDAVIVAIGPHQLKALLPDAAPEYEYQPIYTCYLQYTPEVRLSFPMLGFSAGLVQWAFDRAPLTGEPGLIACVISAQGDHQQLSKDELAAACHRELKEAMPGLPDALSGLTSTIITTRRIERAMQKEGEAVLGLVTITLRGEFRTLSNAPDTIL